MLPAHANSVVYEYEWAEYPSQLSLPLSQAVGALWDSGANEL